LGTNASASSLRVSQHFRHIGAMRLVFRLLKQNLHRADKPPAAGLLRDYERPFPASDRIGDTVPK